MGQLITLILWGIIGLGTYASFVEYLNEIKGFNHFILFLICFIGGPIIMASNVLSAILDKILPEGWNDDDGPNPH